MLEPWPASSVVRASAPTQKGLRSESGQGLILGLQVQSLDSLECLWKATNQCVFFYSSSSSPSTLSKKKIWKG